MCILRCLEVIGQGSLLWEPRRGLACENKEGPALRVLTHRAKNGSPTFPLDVLFLSL